ncbi:MAG: hypothetical protein JNL67_06425 [Planctomycetaceae bacterium]|nr:hypothetical protein [Planctomycetaceae bacterium]
MVDLAKLPRLNEQMVMQIGPTYLSYSGQGTVAEADSHVKALLASSQWKEIPGLSPPTEQYVDRTFEKGGYYVRANVSQGSSSNEFGITLSNLGNIDVRTLPRLADADATDIPSTPVNFTYKTNRNLTDAHTEIHQQMLVAGWQVWEEPQESPIAAPHFRNVHYRKEACRVNVGLFQNPQNVNDKTSVFYHAEYVTPFDIPTLDSKQSIRLDLISNQVTFPFTSDRGELIDLLQAHSERYGWNIKQAEEFRAGKIHLLAIDLASDMYLVARLMESGGEYRVSLESYAVATKTDDAVAADSTSMAEANSEDTRSQDNDQSTEESLADNLANQLDATIHAELSKAMDSIDSPPSNLADLEAKLKALRGSDENVDEMDDEDALDHEAESQNHSQENPFDVAEDKVGPPEEIAKIEQALGTLKYGDQTYELKHSACYVINYFGMPTKCLIFSSSPIDVQKLREELQQDGRPVHGLSVSEDANVLLDIRISKNDTMVSAQIDASSLGFNTEKIESNLFYFSGKLSGTAKTTEPFNLGSEPLEFAIQLNQPVVQVAWPNK